MFAVMASLVNSLARTAISFVACDLLHVILLHSERQRQYLWDTEQHTVAKAAQDCTLYIHTYHTYH